MYKILRRVFAALVCLKLSSIDINVMFVLSIKKKKLFSNKITTKFMVDDIKPL